MLGLGRIDPGQHSELKISNTQVWQQAHLILNRSPVQWPVSYVIHVSHFIFIAFISLFYTFIISLLCFICLHTLHVSHDYMPMSHSFWLQHHISWITTFVTVADNSWEQNGDRTCSQEHRWYGTFAPEQKQITKSKYKATYHGTERIHSQVCQNFNIMFSS